MVHHRVDGFLQLQNFAAHIGRDLFRQVAVRDGRRHFRNVAHLSRQVTRHGIHAVRQVLPNTTHIPHLRLAAQFAVSADFARHPGHFGRKTAQLVHHRVDCIFELENFSAHVGRDFL
ncbi:MAG: hypothetical protein QM771_08810 [Nitrospira sp.]